MGFRATKYDRRFDV